MQLIVPPEFLRGDAAGMAYGTAGFRAKAEGLDWVVFRVGLVGALRSGSLSGRPVGLMITASHNPVADNGAKLMDPLGEMLEAAWEHHATRIVNAKDSELQSVVSEITILEDVKSPAAVFGAYDTRPSSIRLEKAAEAGATAGGAVFTSFGLLTTPQLHYIVKTTNEPEEGSAPTEEGYYKRFAGAFRDFATNYAAAEPKSYAPKLYVDAANGVGAPKLAQLLAAINEGKQLLDVTIVNDGDGELNHECGADFVKLHQAAPQLPEGVSLKPGDRWASFDGDADRIVYYFVDKDGTFVLLDGDAIAVLAAGWVGEALAEAGLRDVTKLGVVQTAYANGASTAYLEKEMGIPVVCVATGVKHLHAAATSLDLGVYFEANGHGTLLLNAHPKNQEELAGLEAFSPGGPNTLRHFLSPKLKAFMGLVNEAVGDALADLLVVEAILCARDWDAEHWAATYTDLPSRQLKVPVPNRAAIRTTDAERRVSEPAALQAEIERLVAGVGAAEARAFVRPSGTEDVVRVYAEAPTRDQADALADAVKAAVTNILG